MIVTFILLERISGSLRNVSIKSIEKLDGLLSSEFDYNDSCRSRYQSFMYGKTLPFKPSPYLVSKLRNYEEHHRRCGPGTRPYTNALKHLNSHNTTAPTDDCNYVVWISFSGLGNRILTITSAFLYALLTNRVLLIDQANHMTDLFCEPFPFTSWFLPQDFPLQKNFQNFHQNSSECHGYMVKNKVLINSSIEMIPPYIYLHLSHDYNRYDKSFFCDKEQPLLRKVPWLIMKTDNYFVPSLFFIESFEEELFKLFPEKDTIFHHLGRYLFHPTDQVWGLITRYYNTYFVTADEKIGLQIRSFRGPNYISQVTDQIISCISNEKLLPKINDKLNDSLSFESSKKPKYIAVLITSLEDGYYETLKELYWEHQTITGEMVGFYQPSHEGYQRSHEKMHERKAWAEIYVLSLSDKLMTSARSTFGYVAQGLGGLKPWILYNLRNKTIGVDPTCGRAMSIEPCFHSPPHRDCKGNIDIDTGKLVPYIRHCEDVSWGLKVVGTHTTQKNL
ncbi:unnamed protein product [Amaranthus hypochondriacus]